MPKINHKFWKNLNLPWTVWCYIVTGIDKVVTIIPGSTHSTWTTGPVKYIHWTHSPSPLTYVLLCIISLCFVSTLYRSSYPWCWPAWYNSKQRGLIWKYSGCLMQQPWFPPGKNLDRQREMFCRINHQWLPHFTSHLSSISLSPSCWIFCSEILLISCVLLLLLLMCHRVDIKTGTKKHPNIPGHPYGISKCIVLGRRSSRLKCSYGSVRP